MDKWRKVVRLYAFSLLAHRQWGLSKENSSSTATISLPLAYLHSQLFASAIDWGAYGKAYGVNNLGKASFNVVAPFTPFSVYYLSIGY